MDTTTDDTPGKAEFDEIVEAIESSTKQDAQIAKVINKKVEQSLEQKQKEAKDNGEEIKPMADKINKILESAGNERKERFYKMHNQPLIDDYYQTELVGNPREGDDTLERNNRWALHSSMKREVDNLRLIALFDDKRGDIPATQNAHLEKHMIDLMRDAGGQVEIINPSKMALGALKIPSQKKRSTAKKKETPQETE